MRARSTSLVLERDVPVAMRDGVRLATDVWRPANGGPFPVLVQRTPYDKAFGLMANGPIDPGRAVEAGYALVIQDVRGRFASEGTFDPFAQEIADGADTIRWAATQPWSTGWVATFGSSYVGATQLLAGIGAANGLGAIAPWITGSEYYEGWTYQGGALQLGLVLHWARGLAVAELDRRVARGEEVAGLREQLDAELRDPWGAYGHLPVSDRPVLITLAPYFAEWLDHPTRDDWWDRTSIADRYERLLVPALHLGGWNDIFLSGTLANYEGMTAAGAPRQRLVVGPWSHGTAGDALGDVSFGPEGSRWALASTDLHLSFFDAVRAGETDGPPVRLFVLGSNRWRDEDVWPLPGAREQPLFLRAGGGLAAEAPGPDERPDEYLFDPLDPAPTAGGQTLMPGHEISVALGPRSQAAIESRPDVLVYSTEPLRDDLEVAGRIRLILYAATSGLDTDWTAKLVDVQPDGTPLSVVDGVLRARFRNGLDRPELLEPGRSYRYTIEVGDTCAVFKRGHRIRLEVSSSNFPRFDRNPNTGAWPAHARRDEFRSARQTVFHDAGSASHLLLPVVAS